MLLLPVCLAPTPLGSCAYISPSLTAELAARFKTDGMLAYVELVQRKEKEIGCDVLTHQKWYVFSCSNCHDSPPTYCHSTGAAPTTSIAFWQAYPPARQAHPPSVRTQQNIRSELLLSNVFMYPADIHVGRSAITKQVNVTH